MGLTSKFFEYTPVIAMLREALRRRKLADQQAAIRAAKRRLRSRPAA